MLCFARSMPVCTYLRSPSSSYDEHRIQAWHPAPDLPLTGTPRVVGTFRCWLYYKRWVNMKRAMLILVFVPGIGLILGGCTDGGISYSSGGYYASDYDVEDDYGYGYRREISPYRYRFYATPHRYDYYLRGSYGPYRSRFYYHRPYGSRRYWHHRGRSGRHHRGRRH